MVNPTMYTVGGTVQANERGLYISRKADEELQKLCLESTFSYVLTPRQLGKSSLMIRTAAQLINDGIRAVIVDLTQIGTQVTADEWYGDFIDIVASQLNLSINVRQWWRTQESGVSRRVTRFFESVLLAEVTDQVVIFVDEIDTTLSLNFANDFYEAILYLYVQRAVNPNLHRLSFVLIGVAAPTDLISDPRRTPFNIGQRVDLTDFTSLQAISLVEGLGLTKELTQQVLNWILMWTGGHPYLTQRLCKELVEHPPPEWAEQVINQVVENLFFGSKSEQDNNLMFVQDMLTIRAPDRLKREVLRTYRQIYRVKELDDEQSLVKSHLKLSGVVKQEDKFLVLRNRIYKEVFNENWIRERLKSEPEIYSVGGTVQAEGGLYISRQADGELLKLCRERAFAYVLTPRQMGKSSLMVRTAEKLQMEGVRTAIIDLQIFGDNTTAEHWYLGFLAELEGKLNLDTDVRQWWQAHSDLDFTQRLALFFEQELLAEIADPVVIFVDEIDSILSLDFTDDFFVAIGALHVARVNQPKFERLSFVLLGVAAPGDLIADSNRMPFDIAQRVDLTDFTLEEAMPLAEGLGLPPEQSQQVLSWVFNWTGGHPYLTQRLFQGLATEPQAVWNETVVDRIARSVFLGYERDNHLQFVRDMLTRRAPQGLRRKVLTTYRDIYRDKQPVLDEEQSLVKSHLKLSGVVRQEGQALKVRNSIYREVFNLQWIEENLPKSLWQRLKRDMPSILVWVILLLAIITVIFEIWVNTNQQQIIVQMNLTASDTLQKLKLQQQQLQQMLNADQEQMIKAETLEKLVIDAQGKAKDASQVADDLKKQIDMQNKLAEDLKKQIDTQNRLVEDLKKQIDTQNRLAEDQKQQADKLDTNANLPEKTTQPPVSSIQAS